MTTNMQQGTILDVLKRKMRQTKEEMEKYKDECEEYHKRLQVEIMRREEVRKRVLNLWCEFCETLVPMCVPVLNPYWVKIWELSVVL